MIRLGAEFVRDLCESREPHFARRVLQRLMDDQGAFRQDQNDHRYHGIENAWIRYISQGSSAYRLIYIREGSIVTLYRVGPHSIEDHLATPSPNYEVAELVGPLDLDGETEVEDPMTSGLLHNHRTRYLLDIFYGRRLIPHKEVILVSPFLSESLFHRTSRLGRMLGDFVEDGSKVTLLTKTPTERTMLDWFADLEARDIAVSFNDSLHAKIYMFMVDQQRVGPHRTYNDTAIIGSANLTESGLPQQRDRGNEELCYELPASELRYALTYVTHLLLKSVDIVHLRTRMPRR